MYNWSFDKSLPISAYEQLADYFKTLIMNGSLLYGQELLSQRDYCAIFNISRPTLSKAFEMLEHEKLIKIEPKKKAIVRLADEIPDYPSVDWSNYTMKAQYAELNKKYKNSNFMRGSHNIINLYECYFGEDFNPHAPVKKAMEHMIKHMPPYHHTNLDVRGTLSLRQSICSHLALSGIHSDPSCVLVCNTLQNAYNIIFSALLNKNMSCYMEEDSIFISGSNNQNIALPMDDEGILIKPLIERLKAKRRGFLLVDTQYNMPGGITYSKQRRADIMNVSREWKLPIVESEVVKDCWHETPPIPSMKSLDTHQNIIYIFSLARPFMPLLTSAIIAPEPLMPVFMDIKLQYDEYTDIITQSLLERMLSCGFYADYMDEIRPLIVEKCNQTDRLLHKYFDGIASWKVPKSGVNFRIDFDFDISKIFPILEKMGIMLYSPEIFSSKKNFIWFCYTGVEFEKLDYALGKISSCIRNII